MKRPRALVQAISLASFASVALFGCNALLGNEEGTPRVAPQEAGGPAAEAGSDGGTASLLCDTTQGNKVCFGLCVKIDQPNTGCGGPSCTACDPKNVVETACKGGSDTLSCGYNGCKAGFDDCDGQLANGCETSLGSKNACGSCTTKCDGATPFCAVTGGVSGCVASCPNGTTECSGACVDTMTAVENCGTCGNKCERALATATCVGGSCVFVCQSGTHACGTVCVSDLDPAFCGASCTPCPLGGPNTRTTCSAGTCGVTCSQGFLDCDGKAANGCEVNGTFCPLPPSTCGNRGVTCEDKQHCCNGSCISIELPCEKQG